MIINVDMIYPIGSLYITTSAINPSILFGGTWAQLTGDAYLKVVTSGAGSYNGTTTNHTIPINSMPSHNHRVGYAGNLYYQSGGSSWWTAGLTDTDMYSDTKGTDYTGGGQPYYPYYYGVYVWHRTA